MEAQTPHNRRYLTVAACILAYGVVFVGANAEVLSRAAVDAVSTENSATAPNIEAVADEEYFNSPQVGRAMSLNNHDVLQADRAPLTDI